MNIYEAISARHSVRSYEDKPIDEKTLAALENTVSECNKNGGLHIQLVKNEPKAFDSKMAHYGKFSGVTNYLAMIGERGPRLEELCGYYGEKLVLTAQTLGLNSCWVALTYKKIPGAYEIGEKEKLTVVIALGYGKTQGTAHKSKDVSSVSNVDENSPEWFRRGVEAALLAPTALNQQKFRFELCGDKVKAKAGFGINTKTDLGIAKYNFEIGADKENDIWM